MALHETAPFPYSLDEIKELAAQITDPAFAFKSAPKASISSTVMAFTALPIRSICIPNCTLKMMVAMLFIWAWNWPAPRLPGSWANVLTRTKR